MILVVFWLVSEVLLFCFVLLAGCPSGLRGRIANPLFVGSNPTPAFLSLYSQLAFLQLDLVQLAPVFLGGRFKPLCLVFDISLCYSEHTSLAMGFDSISRG